MSEAKTFRIDTLGCKVNQYESMAVKGMLVEAGYLEANKGQDADILIINTCTVTHVADKKSRQAIRRIISKNSNDATVLVMGCYAQLKPEEVSAIEGVDIVIGTEGKGKIREILDSYFYNKELPVFESSTDSFKLATYEEIKSNYQPDNTRAFIKIQDGCNMFCTYCIIPYARGKIRSRKVSDILSELDFLSKSSYKEIVLTGIHLSSYGLDFKKEEYPEDYGIRLINLIEIIAEKFPDIRIRLGSLEPGIISMDFARRIAAISGICDQFHLSLQSGSDSILKLMNRRYDSKKYRDAVDCLRSVFDNPAISSDVIVGFPGESDELFEETVDFCKGIGFANLHVFPYSPREGTPAASMKGQVQKNVKSHRVKTLMELAERMEEDYLRSLIGTFQDVIIEHSEDGILSGRARNYSPVFIEYDEDDKLFHDKKIINCRITGYESKMLKGVF